jgi:hypothetical protein
MHTFDTFKINQVNEVSVGWLRRWDGRKELQDRVGMGSAIIIQL